MKRKSKNVTAKAAAPKGMPETSRPRRTTGRKIERLVHDTLLELMRSSDSDSVRVAAAKALMERMNKKEEGAEDEMQQRAKERDEAIAETSGLLERLAASKSSRSARKVAMA